MIFENFANFIEVSWNLTVQIWTVLISLYRSLYTRIGWEDQSIDIFDVYRKTKFYFNRINESGSSRPKTFPSLVVSPQKRLPLIPLNTKYILHNIELESASAAKYLCVNIADDLSLWCINSHMIL